MSSTNSPTEAGQIEKANASGKTPVVFIHGLWLLPSSWDRWAYLVRPILEFDDSDWEMFIHNDAPEFFLPALDAMNTDAGANRVEGLLTQVWERP